jgi:hypothetical protein
MRELEGFRGLGMELHIGWDGKEIHSFAAPRIDTREL